MCAEGVRLCTVMGMQMGVQNQWFVRRSCRARKSVVAGAGFRPATKLNVQLLERVERPRALEKSGTLRRCCPGRCWLMIALVQ